MDDGLEENRASFAALEYPEYEVVLGVRDARDAAYPVARAAARRWPGRFRVAVQRGEPGLNPKVNQLATLARAARHDSDSNVRVAPGYLSEIAALLEDDAVGRRSRPRWRSETWARVRITRRGSDQARVLRRRRWRDDPARVGPRGVARARGLVRPTPAGAVTRPNRQRPGSLRGA